MKQGLIIWWILCGVVDAVAQQSVADTSGLALGEVVVTAQRHERQALLLPASVNKLGQQQLQQTNARSTPEALMGMNGVFVQKTNHGGGSPFVRGLTGNQLLILIDGIRLNNATFRYGPNQYLNTVDPYTVQRIEVVKGTGSVQYGTDAIGGVINILTQEPVFADKPHWQGRVAAKYITGNMEKTGRGEMVYANKKMALLAGISRKSFGDLIGGDTTGKQSPSGYEEWSADAKAKFLLCHHIQLTLATQLLRQWQVPVYHKLLLENFAINEMDPQQRLLSYARLQVKGRSPLLQQTTLTLSFQQQTEGRRSRKNGSTALRIEKDDTQTAGLTLDIYSVFHRNWTSNSGIELYHDRVGSARQDINTQTGLAVQKRGLYPDGARAGNYSMYTLHHLRWGKWLIDAGLRFNTFNIQVADSSLGKVRIRPAAVLGNAALLYQLTKHQSLYAAFSSGFRAPNIDDMGTLGIVDFRYELPTAGLKPEHAQHSELGYKWQDKKWEAAFALYYMHLNNLITRVKVEGQSIGGYQVYRKENTESAFIKGFEASLRWQPNKQWQFHCAIAYARGTSISKNEPMRRIPPLNGRLAGQYRIKNITAMAEYQFAAAQNRLAQGDKEDNRIPLGGIPGWQLVNLFTGYQHSWGQINMGLQNLLNKDYRTHGSGINGAGRSIWINCNIKIN